MSQASSRLFFYRSVEYAELLKEVPRFRSSLTSDNAMDTLKQTRKRRKKYAQILDTDFFGGEALRQTDAAPRELEEGANRALSPDEPHAAAEATIPHLSIAAYQGYSAPTQQFSARKQIRPFIVSKLAV